MVFSNHLFVAGSKKLQASLKKKHLGLLLSLIIFEHQIIVQIVSSVCILIKRAKRNRIYHRSSMQTEKSQTEGKRIMLEMRCTKLPALSVNPRVGISWSALETND